LLIRGATLLAAFLAGTAMKTMRLPTRLAALLALLSISASMSAQHPLDSWVRRTLPGPSAPLQGVSYGNGVFVAVGDNSFVARSPDGATWTTSTSGAYGTLKRVRFLNGQFVAVGSSDKILFSSDGASWTPQTLPGSDFWDVAWGNGVYVIAGFSTYFSSDGFHWSQTRALTAYTNTSPFVVTYDETIFDTIVFANGRFLSLPTGTPQVQALPFHNYRNSFFSTDGSNWLTGGQALLSHRGDEGTSELVFGDGVWLSTTQEGLGHSDAGVTPSTDDGASWCCDYKGYNGQGRWGGAVSFGQGQYLWVQNHNVVSYPRKLTVYSSTNGFLWTERFTETNELSVLARSADFGNGTFVVVGNDESGAAYILQSGNISGAPTIFQQPQDRGAVALNPASFTVQAVGAPPLSYQWYKNGGPVVNATNTSFNISSVVTGDIGGYQVVIANSFGSVTSRVAQLTVSFLDISCYAGIKVLGVAGRTYRIEATPASGALNWQTVTNLVLPASPYIWIDYDSPSESARLYRATESP
jgi:hypothetical protein